MTDPNFSVYIDNQNKFTPPKQDFLQQYMSKIYPKSTTEWIDDNMVKKCQICRSTFGIINRKHHCRACGGVFCSECCNTYSVIPSHLFDKPDEIRSLKVNITNIFHSWNNGNKKLVCIECNNKIERILKIEWIIKICEFLDLRSLFVCLQVNRNFHNASIHWISRVRDIQYISSQIIYSKWQHNMLWFLKKQMITHNNWYIHIVKSTLSTYIHHGINNIPNLIDIIKYTKNNKNIKKISCWTLMCSRKCSYHTDIQDVLDIFQYVCKDNLSINTFWKSKDMKELFILLIDNVTEKAFYKPNEHIIPILSITIRLITNVRYNIDEEYIYQWLDKISKNDLHFLIMLTLECNYLYSHKRNKKYCRIINNYIAKKLNAKQKNMITNTITTFSYLDIKKNKYNVNELNLPILYPFDTKYMITEILNIKELESNSRPLLLTIKIEYNNKKKNKKIILKRDMYLRKENIVSSLIMSLQNKLYLQAQKNRLDKFELIPTYKILMISSNLGIIEFVENSVTLRYINMKNYTLQNYIYEYNKTQVIDNIKERFVKSLSISSCLSYILGLGDRHLDNIMVNKRGQIFHIDYGYIMENPITNIFGAPVIRITNDMIDFLGGVNSRYYKDFKNYVISVFDILRLYCNIILNYYYILGYEKLINWEDFKRKITNRFLKGLSSEDVEISLMEEIEKSSNSYSALFIDTCHHYGSKFKFF